MLTRWHAYPLPRALSPWETPPGQLRVWSDPLANQQSSTARFETTGHDRPSAARTICGLGLACGPSRSGSSTGLSCRRSMGSGDVRCSVYFARPERRDGRDEFSSKSPAAVSIEDALAFTSTDCERKMHAQIRGFLLT